MRTLDSVVNTKIANRVGAAVIRIDDILAGYPVKPHKNTFRADYKRATRHGRRALNLNLRRGLFDE